MTDARVRNKKRIIPARMSAKKFFMVFSPRAKSTNNFRFYTIVVSLEDN